MQYIVRWGNAPNWTYHGPFASMQEADAWRRQQGSLNPNAGMICTLEPAKVLTLKEEETMTTHAEIKDAVTANLLYEEWCRKQNILATGMAAFQEGYRRGVDAGYVQGQLSHDL
jgi:hypothetical protein